MLQQISRPLQKAREGLGKLFAAPSYDELMARGAHNLVDRPDIAEDYFRQAIGRQSSPEAWRLYAWSLLGQEDMKLKRLDEVVGYEDSGKVTYRDHVRTAHKRVASLSPTAENYYEAALIALRIRDLKDMASYLANAIESKPDDMMLIRIGRLTKSLRMDGLTQKVKDLFRERELSVHLYPIYVDNFNPQRQSA